MFEGLLPKRWKYGSISTAVSLGWRFAVSAGVALARGPVISAVPLGLLFIDIDIYGIATLARRMMPGGPAPATLAASILTEIAILTMSTPAGREIHIVNVP